MKRKKRFLITILFLALAAAGTVRAGESTAEAVTVPEAEHPDEAADDAAQTPAEQQGEEGAAAAHEPEGEGLILRIVTYDAKLIELVDSYVPGYEAVDGTHGRFVSEDGETEVIWTVIPDPDILYQNYLDEVLYSNGGYLPDDRIDLFAADAGFVRKYAVLEKDVTLPLTQLGISEEELSEQFPYTVDLARDGDGTPRGVSYETRAGVMMYRRSIAETVFGSVRHETVQSFFENPDALLAAAEELGGYDIMLAAVPEELYPVYDSMRTTPWVTDRTVMIDPAMERWARDCRRMIDEGQMTAGETGGGAWQKGLKGSKSVFCYFGPESFIEEETYAEEEKSVAASGGWACAAGPAAFYEGGTWLMAANGTDNPTLDALIMRTLCCNTDVMRAMAGSGVTVNNVAVLSGLSADTDASSAVLGGQNIYGMVIDQAKAASAGTAGPYDDVCKRYFISAMADYFNNKMTYEEAESVFAALMKSRFSEFKVEKRTE